MYKKMLALYSHYGIMVIVKGIQNQSLKERTNKMQEKLKNYISVLYEDLNTEDERYNNLIEKIDTIKEQQEKDYYLKALANIAGRIDVTKSVIDYLENIAKEKEE